MGSRHERVRMASIDAPETTKDSTQLGQPVAQASRKALDDLIYGKQLTVLCFEQDRYQRNVCDVPLPEKIDTARVCHESLQGKVTANQCQVAAGLAWANMEGHGKFMRDRALPNLEASARKARRGIWGQSKQVPPWQWRYDCWKQGRC